MKKPKKETYQPLVRSVFIRVSLEHVRGKLQVVMLAQVTHMVFVFASIMNLNIDINGVSNNNNKKKKYNSNFVPSLGTNSIGS